MGLVDGGHTEILTKVLVGRSSEEQTGAVRSRREQCSSPGTSVLQPSQVFLRMTSQTRCGG